MNFTAYEPYTLDPHDIDESLINSGLRPVPVPSKEALKKRRQRLKNGVELVTNWLDQFYGEHERELHVRDIIPVLARYPKLVGEIVLFVRGNGE